MDSFHFVTYGMIIYFAVSLWVTCDICSSYIVRAHPAGVQASLIIICMYFGPLVIAAKCAVIWKLGRAERAEMKKMKVLKS